MPPGRVVGEKVKIGTVIVRLKVCVSAPIAAAVTVNAPVVAFAVSNGLVAAPLAMVQTAVWLPLLFVQPASVPKVAPAPAFGTTVKVMAPPSTGSGWLLVTETARALVKGVAAAVDWPSPVFV